MIIKSWVKGMHKLKFIFTTQGNQNAIDIDGKFF